MPGITTTNLGRVVPLFKGAYNSAANYAKLDIVFYEENGCSYILKADSAQGIAPTTPSYWQKIAEKGGQGDPGDSGPAGQITEVKGNIEMLAPDSDPAIEVINNGSTTNAKLQFNFAVPLGSEPVFRGDYDSAISYQKFDNVLSSGSTYISLIDNNRGNLPYYGSNVWQLLASQGGRGEQGDVPTLHVTEVTAAPAEEASASITQSGSHNENLSFSFGLPPGPIGFDTVSGSASPGVAGTQPDVDVTLSTVEGQRNLNFAFTIPGAEGEGVQQVDGIGPTSNNVILSAIRYVPMVNQQGGDLLSSTEKGIARRNINAMEEPSSKEYGAFLRYSGDVANPQWLAEQISQVPSGGVSGYVLRKQIDGYGWTPVYEVPSGGTTGSILTKNSNTSYDLTWTGNITNADIDIIMSE